MLGYLHMNDQTDPEIDWFLLNGTVAGFWYRDGIIELEWHRLQYD